MRVDGGYKRGTMDAQLRESHDSTSTHGGGVAVRRTHTGRPRGNIHGTTGRTMNSTDRMTMNKNGAKNLRNRTRRGSVNQSQGRRLRAT